MLNRALLLLLLSFYLTICFSQNEYSASGARAFALGGAATTLTDIWSSNNNQAGLAYTKKISAGIYYENRFLLKELSTKNICAAIPIKKSVVGISANSFGYSQFMKNKYGIAFAKMLSEKLSLGIQADFLSTYIGENYGKTYNFSTELGLLYTVFKKTSIGIHIFNPFHTKLAAYNNERVNTNIKLGSCFTLSDKLLLAAELEKEINSAIKFKSGIEYLPIKELALRIGIHTQPSVFSFGFGLNLNKLKLDIASTLHPILGITSHAGMSYEFGK